jgi:tetratricopeptide (TPR) repeat protein
MRRRAIIILITLLGVISSHDIYAVKNTSSMYREAAALAVSGNLSEAITAFKNIITISPSYALAHYGLGKAYLYEKNKVGESIKHLKKSIILDKKNPKAYFYLGMGYMFSGQNQNAIHSFSEAYKYDKSMVEALYNIGILYDLRGNQGMAERYFNMYHVKKRKVSADILF